MSEASESQRRWVTQMLAARMVARVATALAPIARVIPVKGVLVARRFYDDPSERAMCDCDLALLGVSARRAARALVAEGWRVADWSNDPNVVDVSHPSLPGIHADLHARPLPVGYGAVTSRWLADGAREDRALFGVPVLIPDDRKLLVHLLGNILRDHVVNARPHAADDVARVLARSAFPIESFAATARDARLRIGCYTALGWVQSRTREPRVEALREALGLSRVEQRYARWRQGLVATSTERGARLVARVASRCASDEAADMAAGLAAAAYGVARAKAFNFGERVRGG
jgi:hypothetical protein